MIVLNHLAASEGANSPTGSMVRAVSGEPAFASSGETYVQRPPFYFFPNCNSVESPPSLDGSFVCGHPAAFRGSHVARQGKSARHSAIRSTVTGHAEERHLSYDGMRHALIVLPSLAFAGAAALSIAREREVERSFRRDCDLDLPGAGIRHSSVVTRT
jgi:hypothetical protein